MSNLFLKIVNKALFVCPLGFLIIIVSCNSAFAFNSGAQLIFNLKKYHTPKIEIITS